MPAQTNYEKKKLADAYNNLYKNKNNNNNNNSKNNSTNNSYLMTHNVEYSCYYNDVSIINNKFKTSK